MTSPGSRPPRPALLPEEPDDIDYKWGEEPPTVVYPASTGSITSSVELSHEDQSDRVTAIPELPGDEFARRLMAAAVEFGDSFLKGGASSEGVPDGIMDREAATHRPTRTRTPDPEFERGLRGQLELEPSDPLGSPSAHPTAPPSLARTREASPEIPPSLGLIAPSFPGSRGWNGQALEATLRPPRSITPRSHAATSYEFPSYASAPPANGDALLEMRDRFAMGDFSGALAMAEEILGHAPGQKEATSLAEKCREVLFDMYGSRLTNLDEPPRLLMTADQLRWLSLDHRAGFLLSMVDGQSTLEEILDVSGMSRLDAMRILCELLDRKVITIG